MAEYTPTITDIIDESVRYNEPVIIVSRTGMGKTTLITEYAKNHGMNLIHESLASADSATILGMNFPTDKGFVRHDSPLVKAIKQAQHQNAPELIVFFDEILSADEEVYSELQTLILDNYLQYEQMHFEKVHFIGATNTVSNGSNVSMPSQAFAERFAWFPLVDITEWVLWFQESKKRIIPATVMDYIQSNAKSDTEEFVDAILGQRTSPRDFTKSYDLLTKGAKYLGKYVVSEMLYDSVCAMVSSEAPKEIIEEKMSEKDVLSYIRFYLNDPKKFDTELQQIVREYGNIYPRIIPIALGES